MEKDVDCFSLINFVKVMEGDKSGFLLCIFIVVVEILKYYNVDLKGSKVIVFGRLMVVGKLVLMFLLSEYVIVIICYLKIKNLLGVVVEVDVLIVVIGRVKMVDESFVKDGVVVIDVGINVDEEGNLCGDVDINVVLDKVLMIILVLVGVGLVIIFIFVKYVVKVCKL